MTSPQKKVDIEKDNTLFGELTKIQVRLQVSQKQTSMLNKNLAQQFELINRLRGDLNGLQKEAKQTSGDTRGKLNDEVKLFEQRIKNYLVAQKAEYMRFSNQINSMIQNSKEINAQLTLLGTKFDEFQKNVGI